MMVRPNPRIAAFDFDGPLHQYSEGWADGTIYDPPTEGAVQAVREFLEAGWGVVIHTCRVNEDASHEWVESPSLERDSEIRIWLRNWNFPEPWCDTVEIYPKPTASIYIDDRGWRWREGGWPDLVRLLTS